MSKKVLIYFLTVFTLVSCIFLWLICEHSGQFDALGQWNYLNGPMGESYSPVEIMWWIFIFTPVWAGCGWLWDMATRDAGLSLCRYSSMRRWWFGVIGKIYGLNMWYFILFGIMLQLTPECGLSIEYFQRLIVLALHSFAMVTTMLWLYILFQRIIVSITALIVLESTAKIFIMAGIYPLVMPLVWGMYGYCSKFYSTGGFVWSLSVVIQIIYCLTIVILPLFMKKLILRSVRV